MTARTFAWTPLEIGAACVAVGLPALLAFSVPPSTTFLNQAAALIGWGLFALVVAWSLHRPDGARWRVGRGGWCALAALGIVLVASLAAMWTVRLPAALSLSSAGMVAAAAAVLLVGMASRAGVDHDDERDPAFEAFCIALLVAGLLSLGIAMVQYFAPQWTNEDWLARPSSPGRVGGNLRQPNHLSTLLLWAMAATVYLHGVWERRDFMTRAALRTFTAIALVALTFGAVLTVSRTGTVCIVLLAAWGVLDRRLPRFVRVTLWVVPLVYVLFWLGVTEWANSTQHAFAGESQLNKGDLSSSRFGIWNNTWALIRQHPWWGVGWGEFNFAWTLTPFPGRPVAFFDHTHNLPLHLAVELGLPLATLVCGLLLAAFAFAVLQLRRLGERAGGVGACAIVMVLMIGLHSQLEYPLWYAYFLLPAAFAFGAALGGVADGDAPSRPPAASDWRTALLVTAALGVTVGGAAALIDYRRAVVIFMPPEDAAPLDERIVLGQKSWFFSHHADYAAITTKDEPSPSMPAFRGAPHYLLDARLMVAWSKALAEGGDVERARYVAQRLKEFRHPLGNDFFAPCTAVPVPDPLPFQCTPPSRTFTYEDFRMP